MQLLKFGRLVDLEKLETVSVNRAAEELKEQLRSQEFSNAKEIAAWEVRNIICIDDTFYELSSDSARFKTCRKQLEIHLRICIIFHNACFFT